MSSTVITIIVIAVIIIIVIAIAAFFVSRRRRMQQQERQAEARREYGPEYERTAEELGSERKAERDLRERRERVESETEPLSEESKERYQERWDDVERSFVDDPTSALEEADRVVGDILKERNFPTESRKEASRGLGVAHPGVVEDFREAQQVREEAISSEGGGDLERMRQAIHKYRSVYERLTRE